MSADKLRTTPLHYAAAYGSVEVLKLLLAAGGDVRARNTADVTPLIMAASSLRSRLAATTGKRSDGLHIALRRCSRGGKDGRGLTPLMAAVASENQDPAIIKALLASGSDVNAVDSYGDSVLDWACKFRNLSTVRLQEAADGKGRKQEPEVDRSGSDSNTS